MLMAVRVLADPFVVAAPSGGRVRSSLRLSAADEVVVRAVCEHLGRLLRADLAERCRLGTGDMEGRSRPDKHLGRAKRKQALTGECSSRWAGSITRRADDVWERGWLNMADELRDKKAAAKAIMERAAVPLGERGSYRDAGELRVKRERLARHRARIAELKSRIESGRVSVCVGGRRLANSRHHLGAARRNVDDWRAEWEAARWFCTADGDRTYEWGNGLISVSPITGECLITLPRPLRHLANAGSGRYRLSRPVKFSHRAGEWAAHADSGSVRYDISFDPGHRSKRRGEAAVRGRWHIDASWKVDPGDPPTLDELRRHRTLGVDLNADHLAAWVVTADGNPVGPPISIDLPQAGGRQVRDGRLRHAITELLAIARRHGCKSISVENLNFADQRATGRDHRRHPRGRRGRRLRSTVLGIPTAQFRDRLAAMAHNAGIAVIAVDPAYTSKWGNQHWKTYLNTSRTDASSGHHAAGVVIGRRSQGLPAKRRTATTAAGARNSRTSTGQQSMTRATPARANSRHRPATARDVPCGDTPDAACRAVAVKRRRCAGDKPPNPHREAAETSKREPTHRTPPKGAQPISAGLLATREPHPELQPLPTK